MDEKDWTFLQTLYDEKNLTRAAQKLYTSQPALTYRTRQLEQELNIKIFYKGKGNVKFTKQGTLLTQYANKMLIDFSKLKDQLQELNNPKSVILKLSVGDSFAQYELPSVLSSFRNSYSNIKFNVSSIDIDHVLDCLEKAGTHIAIARGDFRPNVTRVILRKDPVCLISKDPILFTDLPNLPRIFFPVSSYSKKLDKQWWQEFFYSPPRIGMVVDKLETCIEMVKRNFGYAILPIDFVRKGRFQNDLYIQSLMHNDNTPFVTELSIYYREEVAESEIIKIFVRFLKQYYN